MFDDMISVCRSPSLSSITAVKSLTSATSTSNGSVHSPAADTPAEQSSAMEPDGNDDGNDDDKPNDEASPVPQVMVGPDGNIIINPGR